MSNITYTSVQTHIDFFNNYSFGAKETYRALANHCHKGKITCNPSLDRIAKMINRSVRSVIRYIKELIESGLVKKQRRGHKSNIYTLTGHIAINPSTQKMEELNESNCLENNPDRNKVAENKTKVSEIVERNVKNKNYKNWVNYNKKKEEIFKPKDEYDYDMKTIREMLGLSLKS